MLNLYIGTHKDELNFINDYFDNWFDDEYLETDFAKRVVKEIDKSDLVSKNLVISPVLGSIPVSFISGGSKSLLLLNYTDKIIPLVKMGDNCYPLLAEIANKKDITVTTRGIVNILGKTNGILSNIKILNDSSIVNNDLDLIKKCVEFGD